MTGIYQRYKLIIIILGIIMLISILWIIISNQHVSKMPSRGVFVLNRLECHSHILIL